MIQTEFGVDIGNGEHQLNISFTHNHCVHHSIKRVDKMSMVKSELL